MHAACQALQVPAEMEVRCTCSGTVCARQSSACELSLCAVQQKSYPRDFYLRGRLRVQLYQPGGSTPVNPKIPTRAS